MGRKAEGLVRMDSLGSPTAPRIWFMAPDSEMKFTTMPAPTTQDRKWGKVNTVW